MKKFFTGGSVTGRNPKLFIGGDPVIMPLKNFDLGPQKVLDYPDKVKATIEWDFSEVEQRVMPTIFAKDLLSCFKSSMSFYFFYVGAEVAQTRIDEEGCGAFFAAVKEEVL